MKPSQMRAELLGQHEALRGIIAVTRAALDQWERDAGANGPVQRCLARLAVAVRAHNQREEELLGVVIRQVDAWGAIRAERMTDEHRAEHEELYTALLEGGSGADAATTVPLLSALLGRMEGHMDREERTLLAEDVLRDDAVVIDSFAG